MGSSELIIPADGGVSVAAAFAVPDAGSRCTPFVVAVSGHRHLPVAALERARGAVAALFGALAAELSDTPLRVMVGMTAGGDLMVAETALELGLPVDAVLPRPLAEHVADFDAANLELINRLLAHPNLHCSELPVMSDAHTSDYAATAQRLTAHRPLSDALIKRGDLMLALWDGEAGTRPSRTADAVLRCLRVRMEEDFDTPDPQFVPGDATADMDSPFVYWIPIASDGAVLRVAETPRFISGLGNTILSFGDVMPAALRMRLGELNDYNRDFVRLRADEPDTALDSLLTNIATELPLGDRLTLARIDLEYGKADALALHFQKRSDRLFGLFGTAAFVIGTLYLIYDKLGENQGFLLAHLVVLLGSLILYRLLYTKAWFSKHLRYRALAETMRVKFYLGLAGVGGRVDAAEVMALSGIERFDGFSWMRFVVKSVEPTGSAVPPVPDARRIDYVRQVWVDNQHRYFLRKVAQLSRNSRTIARGQLATLVCMIGVLLLRLTVAPWLLAVHVTPTVPLKQMLVFCVGLFALLFGAWKLHQSKMATRELTWQYTNQLGHFSRINGEFEQTDSPQRRADLLIELGKRSLMESHLWTIHRYHREHAPPAGGS